MYDEEEDGLWPEREEILSIEEGTDEYADD